MKRFIAIIIIFIVSIPLVFAGDLGGNTMPDENTTVNIVYDGARPISTAVSIAALGKLKTELNTYEKATVLASETDKILAAEKYPYQIDKTEITIIKYRCTVDVCGYWISATRNGQEIQTNSPIWISPPPYEAFVSESFDSAKNEQTITLKEDPKVAVEQILQQYVDRQPVGKPTTGTKE